MNLPRGISKTDAPGLGEAAATFASAVHHCAASDAQGGALAQAQALERAADMLRAAHERSGVIYVVGNGGSAAVASHIVNDFCNTARLRATTLHEPALMTCYANDYGYENAYATMLGRIATANDLLVAISSSGASPNITRAVETVRELGAATVTLSRFDGANPLRASGDLNFWLDSDDYGTVEIGHLFLLHFLASYIARVDPSR